MQSQAQNQTQSLVRNECWPRFAEFDENADKVIDAEELSVDKERIFNVLDRDGNDFLAREEYLGCLAVRGGDAAVIQESFVTFDADHDARISLAEFTAEGQVERTQIVVQERTPRVVVQQAQPTITVDPAQPVVTVDQAQPTVVVDQAPPTVTVQQAQPTVTVRQPPPEVTVQQPQPEVTVQQAEPKVTVQQAEPEVAVQQAEPRVMVEQAEPKVQVQQAEPKVMVEQAEPKVQVQRARPEVEVEREAVAAVERDAAPAVIERDWNRSRPFDTSSLTAEEVLGEDVVNLRGNDVGDVENMVMGRNDDLLYAVVSVGGFLGIGDKDVAVPFSELRLSEDNVILMSQKTEEQLEELPAYEPGQYRPYTQ